MCECMYSVCSAVGAEGQKRCAAITEYEGSQFCYIISILFINLARVLWWEGRSGGRRPGVCLHLL